MITEALFQHLKHQRPHNKVELYKDRADGYILITTDSSIPRQVRLDVFEDTVRIAEIITVYEECGTVDLNHPDSIADLEGRIERIINYDD